MVLRTGGKRGVDASPPPLASLQKEQRTMTQKGGLGFLCMETKAGLKEEEEHTWGRGRP